MQKILLLIVVMFCFYPISTEATGPFNCTTPPCYGSTCDCLLWSPWALKTIDYQVPGYPQCTVKVEYCYRQCIQPGKENCVEMYIGTWYVPALCGTSCVTFMNWITSGTDLEKARKLNRFKIDLVRYISRLQFQIFVDGIPNINIPCSDPNYRFKVTYFQTECGTTCYTQHPIFDPTIQLYVAYHYCSQQFCCRIEEIFCLNADGSINQTENASKTGTAVCVTNPPLTWCEPGENIYIAPCIDPCEDF